MIDKLQLLSGDNVEIEGIGIFKQPKLKEIKGIGMINYYSYISFLVANVTQYLKSIKREDLIPHFRKHNLTMFDICKENPRERYYFIEALSFFIDGDVHFNNGFFINKFSLNQDNYSDVLSIIGQMNYFKGNNKEEVYANDKAQQIAERLAKAKEKSQNNSGKDDLFLDTIISAVSSKHPSLNLLNIWDLTVYQLYDQYHRLFQIDEFDIQAMNYAYWGGTGFKVSWAKPINLSI